MLLHVVVLRFFLGRAESYRVLRVHATASRKKSRNHTILFVVTTTGRANKLCIIVHKKKKIKKIRRPYKFVTGWESSLTKPAHTDIAFVFLR